MENQAGNIDDRLVALQEIALPPAVPYVPQTVGWLVVAAVLVLVLAFLAWRIVRHRRANAYRREALAELEKIEEALLARNAAIPPSPASTPYSATRGDAGWGALPALLKRTAISATSRRQVAALTGDEWLRFLDRSLGNGAEFERGPGRLLMQLAYSPVAPTASAEQLRSLLDLSRRWIRHHHADV